MISGSEPIFAVADVRATVAFYRNVLGFETEWPWGGDGPDTPPTFGGVRLGKAGIMFSLQPELAAKVEGHQHLFKVEDVQALFDRHRAAGAQVLQPLENKPWGTREYTLRDLNGYHLRFAGPATYERPKSANEQLPQHVRIESRKPTLEEYYALTDAVGWNKDATTMPQVMEHTRLGVVAVDTRDGRTVGMLRVCGDGRFFTVWNVMVLPGHQGQKIGTALMERAMEDLKSIAPKGAFVGLFTGKPKFYERLGFSESGGMQRGV